MKDKFVITIGREYGSGGREIGAKLAHIFGIGYYDKKIISEASRRSGLSGEALERNDERVYGSWFHALSLGFSFTKDFTPESFFKIQSDAILDIASRESCVIVGRCADYVLREHPGCVNIFISAPKADRTRRIAHRKGISVKEAAEIMHKVDKSRSSYYSFYTDKEWGRADSYNLCIDSSVLGLEESAEFIAEFVRKALAEE